MRKRFSGPQIVAKLRQADVLMMSPDMIKQLRALQKENAQLKRLVADQALDISILKVAAEGNF